MARTKPGSRMNLFDVHVAALVEHPTVDLAGLIRQE